MAITDSILEALEERGVDALEDLAELEQLLADPEDLETCEHDVE